MAIVGAASESPDVVGRMSRLLPAYRVRHALRPGITGWAQVRHRLGNSDDDARLELEYDLYYIKHAAGLGGLLISLQTIPGRD